MSHGAAIARNAAWNFAGSILPLIAAVLAIPGIIDGLGTERFGALTLAWAVMGYFALFDLGLGGATTKYVAEHIERRALALLPRLIWTSLTAHVALGLLGGALLAILTPWVSDRILHVPSELSRELNLSFVLLAISVPVVVVSACLRGLLEAMHRFDLVNIIRTPAGVVNYVGPLVVVLFTNDLVAVVGLIVVTRIFVLGAYAFASVRQLPVPMGRYSCDVKLTVPLIRFGGWLTISNLMPPMVTLLDRLAVGALVSMTAVAYYATPYEVVTKLWIFSASLLAAMFPVFSALSVVPDDKIRKLHRSASRYLLTVVAPVVGILLIFADELLTAWLGPEFGSDSAASAKWLSIGVFLNVLAQVPFTVLQGIGRPGTVAGLQLMLLPFYVAAMYWLTSRYGVVGTAMAWAARASVEYVLLAYLAERLMPEPARGGAGYEARGLAIAIAGLTAFWLAGHALDGDMVFEIAAFCIIATLFIALQWRFVLDAADRASLIEAARSARRCLTNP